MKRWVIVAAASVTGALLGFVGGVLAAAENLDHGNLEPCDCPRAESPPRYGQWGPQAPGGHDATATQQQASTR